MIIIILAAFTSMALAITDSFVSAAFAAVVFTSGLTITIRPFRNNMLHDPVSNSRPLSVCKILGAPKSAKILINSSATASAVLDFIGRSKTYFVR